MNMKTFRLIRSQSTDTEVELTEGMNLDKVLPGRCLVLSYKQSTKFSGLKTFLFFCVCFVEYIILYLLLVC